MLSLSFSQIVKSSAPLTHIECAVNVRPEFLQRSQKLLYKVENVQFVGDVFYSEPYVTGNFQVTANLVVPSSRSLEPVEYYENFRYSESYTTTDIPKEELDESDIPIVKIEDDNIDLQTAIEDNILLRIPVTILTPEEEKDNIYPQGNGWTVISEAEFNKGKSNQINPAFAKLKNLFNQENDNQDSE